MFKKMNLTVRGRIFLLLGCFVISMLIMQTAGWMVQRSLFNKVYLPLFAEKVLDTHKVTMQSGVECQISALTEKLKGVTDPKEQAAIVERETDPVRFYEDKSGYFFSYTTEGVRVNVPTNKSQNGQNLIDLKDQKGNPFIRELIKAAEQGGGFVEYYFEKPGKGIQPKLSYVKMIPGTSILIGTGVYIDNVAQETELLNEKLDKAKKPFTIGQTVLYGVVAAVTLVFSVLISRDTTRRISSAVTALRQSSESIHNASQQVATASQSLAQSCSEQAAVQEESSAGLAEVSSMTKQNSEHSQQASDLAKEAEQAVSEGSQAISRMNQAIQKIRQSSEETSKIIKVIDEIAFQTNLLALNAAVEAARAGEAGKGFAVVAEEVRNLAMRSAEAAKNTSSLIEQAVNNAGQGVVCIEDVNTSLGTITAAIGKTNQIIAEIAGASQEQASKLQQITASASEIDKTTQQNAAIAEESASAANELQSMVQDLNSVVYHLLQLAGSGQAAGTKTAQISKSLLLTDHLYHQIAEAPNKSARQRV